MMPPSQDGHSMTLVEIVTVIVIVFACWFALTRASSVPRQLWMTPAAAFGCAILALGIGATTNLFVTGMEATLGTSEANRAAAFEALVATAYRPLRIAVLGMLIYVAFLRSSGSGDAEGGAPIGNVLSAIIVLLAFSTCIGAFMYHVGFIFQHEEARLQWWMAVTLALSVVTVVASGVFGGASYYLSMRAQRSA
jgi:hypothetical protein